MQMRPAELAGIRAGEVDVAFRQWERPRVRVGTRMRTAVGLVEVTSVDRVPLRSLTAADARRAGAASLAALRQGLPELMHFVALPQIDRRTHTLMARESGQGGMRRRAGSMPGRLSGSRHEYEPGSAPRTSGAG
ncbi:hypothetical protein GCM10010199_13430 [Dactylosporangium roseum]